MFTFSRRNPVCTQNRSRWAELSTKGNRKFSTPWTLPELVVVDQICLPFLHQGKQPPCQRNETRKLHSTSAVRRLPWTPRRYDRRKRHYQGRKACLPRSVWEQTPESGKWPRICVRDHESSYCRKRRSDPRLHGRKSLKAAWNSLLWGRLTNLPILEIPCCEAAWQIFQ